MPQAHRRATTPLSPYRVIWDLLHTVDVGEHHHHARRGQPARPDLALLGVHRRRSATSAGARRRSSATASASRWAPSSRKPDKLCINVWGDAAIGFTGMDFETAVRERIPILSILFNNFSMAIELPVMKMSTEKYRSHRHLRQLRRHGQGLRRLRRARHRARRDRPGDQARHRARRRRARPCCSSSSPRRRSSSRCSRDRDNPRRARE